MQSLLSGLLCVLLSTDLLPVEGQDAGVRMTFTPGCRVLCHQGRCTTTCESGATSQLGTGPVDGTGSSAGPGPVATSQIIKDVQSGAASSMAVREQRRPPAETQQSGSSRASLPSPPGQTQNKFLAQILRGDQVYTEHSGFKYCFREVKDGKCASPLPGLRTQEMCCRGIGQAWGTSDCVLCPRSGQNSSCQSGFRLVNGTKCVDVNECVQPELCENGVCVNTMGSYSCVCRPGFILDASHGLCISRSVISEEKGQCYRVLSPSPDLSYCSLPILRNITRQICCCSRVGKAWGPDCERCPYFGSEAFKQTCPAGPGYQYSASTLQFNQRASQQLGSRGAPLVPQRDHHSRGSGSRFSGSAITPEGGSADVTKVSVLVSLPPMNPPLAASARPNADVSGTLQISGSSSDTKPSRTSAQQNKLNQNVPQRPPDRRTQDTQIYQHARLDNSQWNLDSRRRPTPSPAPQRRPAPSLAPQRRPVLSLAPQRRPVPSLAPQRRPPPSPVPQRRPVPSLAPQRRPPPSPAPRRRPAPTRPPTLPPRVRPRSVCENRPDACGPGRCVDQLRGRYTCVCHEGYRPNLHMTFCQDRDECLQSPCGDAHCTNTPGSFRCVCRHGYRLNNATCTDIDECLDPLQCPGQECLNGPGSYRCVSCQRGFHLLDRLCTDVDECSEASQCPGQLCVNTEGSYHCVSCDRGYTLINRQCTDVNECEDFGSCPGRECVNTEGSFRCVDCRHGYQAVNGVCADIDECLLSDYCFPRGECVNVPGSYRCVCAEGFTPSADGSACLDVDECVSVGGPACASGACVNTIGSYHCITSCRPGFRRSFSGECTDVNECEDVGLCPGRECVNTEGSYRCVSCRHGYQAVNGVCAAILRLESLPSPTLTSEPLPLPSPGPGEVRECYYNLAEQGTCNLLATNTTQQECCCTVGEGWGLGCQYQICPPIHSIQFQVLCPSGRGYVTGSLGAFSYTDVDECKRFHPEVCKNGVCVNNIPGYNCYCPSGYVYDGTLLECVDHDECEEESCIGGTCVNTVGSYYCSCPPPLSLDDTQRTCVNTSHLSLDENVSLCWRHVTANLVCQNPLLGAQVSFSDCCCLYGSGWGMECALCPASDSDKYAALCSSILPLPDAVPELTRRGDRFRGRTTGTLRSEDRPGFPRPEFSSYPDEDYGAPPRRPPSFYLPQDPRADQIFRAPPPPPLITEDYEDTRTPFYDRRAGTQRRVYDRRYEALAEDDCGILFGCENGRCIRVAEGYTCDCYYGYQLDLTFMTCIDVNECDDLAAVDFPCVNSRCVNTEGSFRCVCRRGYVMSHRPNHCVAA